MSDPIAEFWHRCRQDDPGLPVAVPEAWSFGATPAQADELLGLVLNGTKTGTASSLWDHEADGDPLPVPGAWGIILDGRGAPRAVVQTTGVRIVPFDEVDSAHAFAEGEGDRMLPHWRAVHERFWREHSSSPRGFAPDMPVVCELFRRAFPA